METYAKRLHAQSIEGFASDIRTLLSNAKTNFTARVHQGRDDLHALRLRVTESDRTYDHFRRENGLIRMAHYPESRKFHIGILVFILLAEAILNGSMLARGHELGILGGVSSAFIIALVNVLGRARAGPSGHRSGTAWKPRSPWLSGRPAGCPRGSPPGGIGR